MTTHISPLTVVSVAASLLWWHSPPLVVLRGADAFLRPCDKSLRRARRRVTRLQIAPQQLGEFEPIQTLQGSRSERKVRLYNFLSSDGSETTTIPYKEAWAFQHSLVKHQLERLGKRPIDPPLYDQFLVDVREDGTSMAINQLGCDSVIFLEHDPVYTLGTGSDPSFILDESIEIVRIERGGEVTYHGPGQLTVYPILDLRGYKQDIHWYMRALEEVILLALQKSGVDNATREEDLTGVWVSDKKIAALGIKARRWVTMHGLAINVDSRSLRNFEGIVPCGLEGRTVTCIDDEIKGQMCDLNEFACHVKSAIEEIFQITLVES
mmetsp:Transcript_19495/g.45726  ORF Transcript_19495/g.45726 Transcript_19495/m.45726 type:complete len:323 (-) Transcript_19495:196-1164(-)